MRRRIQGTGRESIERFESRYCGGPTLGSPQLQLTLWRPKLRQAQTWIGGLGEASALLAAISAVIGVMAAATT